MHVAIRTELASFRNASSASDGAEKRMAVGRRRYSTMATVLLVLAMCATTSTALRCYCTTDKGPSNCENGVCEIHVDPSNPKHAGLRPVCAALNHSDTGVHYSCTRSRTDADETTCRVGPTKEGGTVTACWCRNADFCNEKLFGRTLMDSSAAADDDEGDDYRAGATSAEHSNGHSNRHSVDRSPVEHLERPNFHNHHSPPIEQREQHEQHEQHEQPVSDTEDIEITPAKIDDIDDDDDDDMGHHRPATHSNKFEYYDDDDEGDEDDGDIAIGRQGEEDEDDKGDDDDYYDNNNGADPFVEHTSEHTTSTTKKEPVVFETTPPPTYLPRMFTPKKLTTTLYWRPSAATTTTSPPTTTTSKPTTTARTTTARATSSSATTTPSRKTSSDGSSSEHGRIKALYPSAVETITQSVPRAVYGQATTTGDLSEEKVGDGVDSRANGQREGYGYGVNSRVDTDHSIEMKGGRDEKTRSNEMGEKTGGGRVTWNACGRTTGSDRLLSLTAALTLFLSVLPVFL